MIISHQTKSLLIMLFLTSLMFFSLPSKAAIETFEFQSPEQEQTFHELTKLLRCPKCQNQNIADSNAELAKDLRNKNVPNKLKENALNASKTVQDLNTPRFSLTAKE